jgi:hypothetical protein
VTLLIDWLFRNRHTGRITIAQFPNVPLWLFLAATAVQRLADPAGDVRTAVRVVATVGIVWWAIDEVFRGVNPWRRFLGGGVLAAQVVTYLR